MINSKLSRYYTPEWIADELLARIPFKPVKVLDLCCGAGALAQAAARRFRLDDLVTIDLDRNIDTTAFGSLAKNHKHYTLDALHPDVLNFTGLSGQFDLVLCNPPFGRTSPHLINDDLLANAYSTKQSSLGNPPAEMIGLAHALRFACTGGVVAAIMPDTLMTGHRAQRFRKRLLHTQQVERIVELPGRAFADTEAKTFLMIIKKGGWTNSICAERLSANGTVLVEHNLSPRAAVEKMAPHSHCRDKGNQALTSLASLGVSIQRGRIGASEAKMQGKPYFHTNHFSQAIEGAVNFDYYGREDDAIVAREGDILVARVHRSLHEKVVIVEKGQRPITDCVYRIRCANMDQKRIWKSLRSLAGQERLASASRGVGAKHLPLSDLNQILV